MREKSCALLFIHLVVYLICRDNRTGRVITIQDNRALLESRAATNPTKNDAVSKILGVFNK